MPPPRLDITIPTTHTSPDPKPHTVYTIHIRTSALRTTIVHKRYSDFVSLHSSLISQTSAPPPAPLPPTSWLGGLLGGGTKDKRTVEERRQGLEAYLRAIAADNDARWRQSKAFREFLELKDSWVVGRRGWGDEEEIMSASEWLDAYADLKRKLQDARTFLARREQASTAPAQHEASAKAKAALVSAMQLVSRLDTGLKRFIADADNKSEGTDEWDVEKLGEGEVRRRRDLLAAARKEREGLEAVLSSLAVKSAIAATAVSSSAATAAATEGDTSLLFRGAGSSSHPTQGRRVLGAPLPETAKTRELDNAGVLQLQKQVMAEQEQDVVDLTKVVRRMKEMGVQINEELVLQNALLDDVERDVERVDGKIRIAKKKTAMLR